MTFHWASFEGFSGCLASAEHAAAVLGGSAEALVPGAERSRDWRAAEIVVLSSWHESYEPLLDSGARIVLRWHSPVLQTELSGEGWKLARQLELLDGGRVPAIVVNVPAIAAALGRDRVVCLPDVLAPAAVGDPSAGRTDGVAISLFGEPHARKNLMAQAAAVAIAARESGDAWRIHLAGQTHRRPGYARWLDMLGVDWVDHGRLPRGEYLDLMASMDAGLAATLSESYGYVAAEHVLLGVPVVTGPAVACLPPGELTVTDPGDPQALAKALLEAVRQGGERVERQRAALLAQARENEVAAQAGVASIERLIGHELG